MAALNSLNAERAGRLRCRELVNLTFMGGRGIARAMVALAMVVALGREARAQATPVGLWNTISDKDGKPEAVVEIREVNGQLSGVVRELLVAADPQDSICGKCTDDRKGQRVVGMEILRHMHRDGDEWSGGEILDPENGKTYRATLKLAAGGQKLQVRGYIGMPIFGRSQTWLRRTAHE
jgi:uncharacterized protein (DUF2147 family)